MMIPLAHLTNEPHMALSAVLAVFALGLAAGVCAGWVLAHKSKRGEARN